jgi:hypothetical protein
VLPCGCAAQAASAVKLRSTVLRDGPPPLVAAAAAPRRPVARFMVRRAPWDVKHSRDARARLVPDRRNARAFLLSSLRAVPAAAHPLQPALEDDFDDLPLDFGGEDEEEGGDSHGALLQLLQRLRFGGDAALGMDLCELALAGLAPEAAQHRAALRSGDALAAAQPLLPPAASAAPARPAQPQQPQLDRAAARRRARFVRSLVLDSLRSTQRHDCSGDGGGAP